jgi:hypothetical protein
MGNSPIRLKLFIAGFVGFFYGFGLWEVEMLWVWVMGVTLVQVNSGILSAGEHSWFCFRDQVPFLVIFSDLTS